MRKIGVDLDGPYRLVPRRRKGKKSELVKQHAFRKTCEGCGDGYWAWAEEAAGLCAKCLMFGERRKERASTT